MHIPRWYAASIRILLAPLEDPPPVALSARGMKTDPRPPGSHMYAACRFGVVQTHMRRRCTPTWCTSVWCVQLAVYNRVSTLVVDNGLCVLHIVDVNDARVTRFTTGNTTANGRVRYYGATVTPVGGKPRRIAIKVTDGFGVSCGSFTYPTVDAFVAAWPQFAGRVK